MLVNQFSKCIVFRLSNEMYQDLEKIAHARSLSMSCLVRGIINDYLIADKQMRKFNQLLNEMRQGEE